MALFGAFIFGSSTFGTGLAVVPRTGMFRAAGGYDLVLSDRWGGDPFRISGWGIRASREVSAHGTLSFFVPAADALRANARYWKGMWLTYRHPSGFVWGGFVTATRPGSGAWEIAAHSWEAMFVKRRTAPRAKPLTATPGGVMLRLINEAQNDDALPLGDRFADEGGDGVRLDTRAMDLYANAFPALANAGPFEWTIDAESRDLRCGPRVGTDRTADFRLCEGRHVAAFDPLDDDLWTVVNDWYGVPVKRNPNSLPGLVVEDADSIAAYGRLQDTVAVNELDRQALQPILKRRLAMTRAPLPAGTLGILDVDGCWGWFGVGDLLRITLDSAGMEVGFRAMSLALDHDAGRMDVSGYVEGIFAEVMAA